MRKTVKRLLVLVLALTFIVTDLAVAPVTTQAAGILKFQKSATLMKGDEIGYGIINSVRSDKILNLKSSKPGVVSVKKMPYLDDYTITMTARKAGTSTVSFTVLRRNGKKHSFKTKVTVCNYTNPLSACKLGKKDYKKSLDKRKMVAVDPKYRKGKVNIAFKKGYKLIGLYYSEHGSGRQKQIRNGSTINLDGSHYLQIWYKNTSLNYTYSVYLDGSTL